MTAWEENGEDEEERRGGVYPLSSVSLRRRR